MLERDRVFNQCLDFLVPEVFLSDLALRRLLRWNLKHFSMSCMEARRQNVKRIDFKVERRSYFWCQKMSFIITPSIIHFPTSIPIVEGADKGKERTLIDYNRNSLDKHNQRAEASGRGSEKGKLEVSKYFMKGISMKRGIVCQSWWIRAVIKNNCRENEFFSARSLSSRFHLAIILFPFTGFNY